MSNAITVDTRGVQQMVGRKIVAAHREPPSDYGHPLIDESLTLTLDDGSVWEFVGIGYDTSYLEIYVSRPDEIAEVK